MGIRAHLYELKIKKEVFNLGELYELGINRFIDYYKLNEDCCGMISIYRGDVQEEIKRVNNEYKGEKKEKALEILEGIIKEMDNEDTDYLDVYLF